MKFFTTSRLSENILKTPEGYLVCIGVPIARTGEMEYGDKEVPIKAGPDGKVIILRKADEVFRPETIKSFEGKPITILHPKDMVAPETWGDLANGVIQNVRRGEGETENDLVADLLIQTARAIQLVQEGLREVSCGYDADYYEVGIGRGEQKNIIGNHLALVTEARAGSSYAINDSKGKGQNMKFSEILEALKKNKFKKADVEAIRAAANDAALEEKEESKDGARPVTYDEMKKCMDEGFAKFGKKDEPAKDASTQPAPGTPAQVVAKDEEVAPSLEDRMKKLEEAVSALLAKQSTGDEEVEMEETEDAGDSDEEAEEEGTEDASEEKEEKGEKKATGDSAGPGDDEDEDDEEELASRAEILVPGIKKDQKNLKAKALRAAYATKDGKAVIDTFTGGKDPDLKNKAWVDVAFVGVSEILKSKRSSEFASTKTFDSSKFQSSVETSKDAMTAEKLNDLNAKHYGTKH